MTNSKRKKVAVLMGGCNSEKEISLLSGEAVYNSLVNIGYQACKIYFDKNIVDNIKEEDPDVIFNALHGKFGEDGRVQGMLDILQIPYTHSNQFSSAICMDKSITKIICAANNIKTARHDCLIKNDNKNNQEKLAKYNKNYVIKPIDDGSSVGVEIFLGDNKFNLKDYNWKFGDKIMIEDYIKGKELQIAVINDEALGVLEVRPENLFYDYQCKYEGGMTEYIIPAQIKASKYQEALDISQKIHKILGCKAISRVEMILSELDNQLYFLEINTQPGFTKNSLVPKIANYKKISFDNIVQYLIETAECAN